METYELPVKFTEEEREYYSAWGIRNAQLLGWCVSLYVFLLIGGLLTTVLMMFDLFHGNYWFYKILVFYSETWVHLIGIVGIFIISIVHYILNLLFNRRKPNFKQIVKVTIDEKVVTVALWKKRRKLKQQEFTLEGIESCFDVKNNCIILNGKYYEIGINTTKTIYEEHIIKKYPVLEHPIYKARSLSKVAQINDILMDYKAALEVKVKEQEWLMVQDEMKGY